MHASNNTGGIRRSLNGPELDQLLSVSRQWRTELVRRGVLPQPHRITAVSRPRWWLDEVLAALAKVQPEAEAAARNRVEHMRSLRDLRKGVPQ